MFYVWFKEEIAWMQSFYPFGTVWWVSTVSLSTILVPLQPAILLLFNECTACPRPCLAMPPPRLVMLDDVM